MSKLVDVRALGVIPRPGETESFSSSDRSGILDALHALKDVRAEPTLDERLKALSDPKLEGQDRVKLLHDILENVRMLAAANDGELPTAMSKKVSASLVTALKDTDKDVRYEATRIAASLGRVAAPELVTTLVDRLNDTLEDPLVRWGVTNALGSMWSHALKNDRVLPALTDALKSKDPLLASGTATALGMVGGGLEGPHLADLMKAVTHPDARVRIGAINGLGHTYVRRPEVIDELVKVLKDNDLTVRIAAAESLARTATFLPQAQFDSVLEALDAAHRGDAKKFPGIGNYLDAISSLCRNRANPNIG